jgi:hypothetical protein
LCFDLAHSLGCDAKTLPGFAQGHGRCAVYSIAKLYYVALTLGKLFDGAANGLLLQADRDLLVGSRPLAWQELAHGRIAFLSGRSVKARHGSGSLTNLLYLFH